MEKDWRMRKVDGSRRRTRLDPIDIIATKSEQSSVWKGGKRVSLLV